MKRNHQKNDKLTQLEQEVTRLSSSLAETMAAVAVKDALLIRTEAARGLAETEVTRLHDRVCVVLFHFGVASGRSAVRRVHEGSLSFPVA